jgi:Icc-related predicted phosphoesterase
MRVHVVSDVHGSAAALARAGADCDIFVCLGDLILFLDYDDPGRGIFADLFGADHAHEYIHARTANDFARAHELSARAWERIGVTDPSERWPVLESMVRQQYGELFEAMPAPALLTYGNVDIPSLWPDFLRAGHDVVDGQTRVVGGLTWGFVGGGLTSPMRTPYEIAPEAYAEKVAALGPVDVLFTHIPPAIPELTYDVAARRFEFGSRALLDYVMDVQPRLHLFGHVHSPLAARRRIGRTECVNVGHFHGRQTPFAIDL